MYVVTIYSLDGCSIIYDKCYHLSEKEDRIEFIYNKSFYCFMFRNILGYSYK